VFEQEALKRVCVVLVDTSHPGNIGAAARAMKTMGLADLRLVRPGRFPAAEATARASGADGVLSAARVCASLDEALQDCGCAIATSARSRTLAWPEITPRAAAAKLLEGAQEATAAVVFGPERSGLSNAELDRCEAMLRIPTVPDFSSLNIAAAVQIVGYELRLACAAEHVQTGAADEQPARLEDMQRFYAALEQILVDIDFLDPANPRLLLRRLRRLFNRARPSDVELNILRGILTAVARQGEKARAFREGNPL
jgi:tRNA/rRNA methyltransferase/tRNA (cytidine32/uridine32-2'-O)-methyltransferase